MGESIVMGIIGGVVGVGLGFVGATVVKKVAKPLTASVGPTTGSATPGGARAAGGGRVPRLAVARSPAVAASAGRRRPPRTPWPCT